MVVSRRESYVGSSGGQVGSLRRFHGRVRYSGGPVDGVYRIAAAPIGASRSYPGINFRRGLGVPLPRAVGTNYLSAA